jgi:drug/metabolite transporter (DMT)-like permease
MTGSSSRTDWLLFALLGFLWGSSFLFIKIGVDAGLTPFTLVSLRLLFGFALLVTVVALAREGLPRSPRMYGHLLVLATFNIAIPFAMITWAERSVPSSLAAVLNSTVPLFSIPIAAVFLHDEPITVNRVAGLLVGFAGVAILVGFDPGQLASGDLLAELALVGAALAYAASTVYARHFVHGLRPMIPALFQVGLALAISATLALTFEHPTQLSLRPEAWLAVVWLGILGSGVAYLVYFRLVRNWGATRTSMVAYLLPMVGIVLGALVLAEAIDARLLLGTALIIVGVGLVNARVSRRWLARRWFIGPPA